MLWSITRHQLLQNKGWVFFLGFGFGFFCNYQKTFLGSKAEKIFWMKVRLMHHSHFLTCFEFHYENSNYYYFSWRNRLIRKFTVGLGAALRLAGSRKKNHKETLWVKRARKFSRGSERGGEWAERRVRLRWKESKSHWQEQTSSEQWMKVSEGWKRSSQLLLLFSEWRLLLCWKPRSWWASIYPFALSWLLWEHPKGSTFP